MASYKGDPYWTTARYAGKCTKCGTHVKRGDRIFYYPRCRSVYCAGPCGQAASAEFEEVTRLEDSGCYPG